MQIYQGIVKGLESIGVDKAFGGNGENIASLTVAEEFHPPSDRHSPRTGGSPDIRFAD
ncbi:MAG: hypothetical protein WBM01_26735 [Mycobacterium sp.]|uniref:hypothetical protein n=1 Tax=Mycobacterium sp. TaxID=1785 RepID=UPI003C73BF63